jgi:predicted PurR-regulated permease PerM
MADTSPADPGAAEAAGSPPAGETAAQFGAVTPLRVIALCAAAATLNFAAPVLIPIVLAVLLFYALDPLVDAFERWRVPRLLASAAVVTIFVAGAAAGSARLWPQIEAVVTEVPRGAERLRAAVGRDAGGHSLLKKLRRATDAIDSAAAEAAPAASATEPGVVRVEVRQPWRVSDWLWARGVGALGLMGQAVTVLFLTVFLLNEDDSFKRKLVRQMETLGSKKLTVQILNDIASQIKRFLWVQALTSTAVALVTGLFLWWMGMDQPAVWGVFAGIMNIVPYFGPLVVSTVLGIVAFLQFGTIGDAALVAAVALAITTFEGMFVTPHLLSRAASLNPVAIFLAIAFWSWAWGIAGMLLAVPLLMTIKAICDHVEGLQPVGEFLGE